jgi:hypothetical protein
MLLNRRNALSFACRLATLPDTPTPPQRLSFLIGFLGKQLLPVLHRQNVPDNCPYESTHTAPADWHLGGPISTDLCNKPPRSNSTTIFVYPSTPLSPA